MYNTTTKTSVFTSKSQRPTTRRFCKALFSLGLCFFLYGQFHCAPAPTFRFLEGGSTDASDKQQEATQRTQDAARKDRDTGRNDRRSSDLASVDVEVSEPAQGLPEGSPDTTRDEHQDTAPRDEAFVPEPNFSRDAPRPDSTHVEHSPPLDRGSLGVGTPCNANGIAGTCLLVSQCTGKRKALPGFCPGPKAVQCCVPDQGGGSTTACDPKKRPQPNTGLKEQAGAKGCLPGMARIESFCMDRYEASLLELTSTGQLRPWSPYFNPGKTKVRAVSLKGAVPQGYITGLQAAAACKAAGKRLCTDQEWLRACRGVKNHTYPYGPTRRPGVCNDARSRHPAVEYFRSSASWVFSKIQHQCLNQLPQSLLRTGTKTGCVNAEGVYDLMGNLHEWTANTSGIFRGGFYVDTYRNGPGCLYRTTAHNRQHWDYSTGFRCCANAK